MCEPACSVGEATDAKITSIDVSGCSAAPCQVTRGTNVSITISFTSGRLLEQKSLTLESV